MTVLKKILISSTRQKRNTFCLTETMPLSKPGAGLLRRGRTETPGYIVIILVLGFYDSQAKEVLPGQNG